MLSVYPQNIPPGRFDPVSLPACMHDGNAGALFEDHVVLADYEAATDSEISAKAGDKVKVIKKEDSGLYPRMSQLPASSPGPPPNSKKMRIIGEWRGRQGFRLNLLFRMVVGDQDNA